ncbi:MAG: glycosyltransferase family 4 protein [Hyphomonadaceae bacterium]|nr:glycosyltransferase family 4 protein [Hyphomonadaceae bacterium]
MAEAISRAGGLALIASAGGRLEPDLETAGGELIKLPVQTKNPITALANTWALYRLAKQRKVDVIHARSRAPAWSAMGAARLAGVPFVTTFHGIYNAHSAPKRFYNSVMARGDVVIANSEYTREHILANYDVKADRVVVIPRGVDVDVFDEARVDFDEVAALRSKWNIAANDSRTILFAPARLTRWKGQLVLIDAIAIIEKRRQGAVKLVFAGDAQGRNAYVDEMTAAIERHGLRETVALAGHLRQMPEAFAASDIAVFPVIEPEAFGRGAVEAQAMGVPVVASDLGGFTETVRDGETGFLVPPGNAAALAAAIERMIDLGAEKRAEMGAKGMARVRAQYSKSALQSATLAVYQRVLREAADKRTVRQPAKPVL